VKNSALFAVLLAACCGCGSGGESAPTGNDDEPIIVEVREGAVYLSNETPYALQVAYLNDVDSRALHIVRTLVPSGVRIMVSGEVLPSAYAAVFDLVLEVPESVGPRVRRKTTVHIDGAVELQARLHDAVDPFSLMVEVAP
jgi:hypothetical protein